MPAMWRANSLTATCIPRQMPRYGICWVRAIRAAVILPSQPRPPKPPGMRIPSALCSRSVTAGSPTVSESTQSISTTASWWMPAWRRASATDR